MSRTPAIQATVAAAADAARRAQAAPAHQAASLHQASGQWSVLADLLLAGARMPRALVREHAAHADSLAAQAGEFAPAPAAPAVLAALYPTA